MFAFVVKFATRLRRTLRHSCCHVVQQHVARNRGFTRTRHAGDGNQSLERNLHAHVVQVVQGSPFERQPIQFGASHCTTRLQRMSHRVQEVTPSLRFSLVSDVLHRTLTHQPPTTLTRTRPNVDDMVCTANGVFVVLHHHQRVAFVAEQMQRVQQNLVVTRMQANRGLIQHIANALQVTTQLRSQANTLCLAAAERGRATV